MKEFLEFGAINEFARVEWLSEDQHRFRLTYNNLFWGSCQLVGHLIQKDNRPCLDLASISVEQIRVRRGEPELLRKIAINFLTKKIYSSPELWRRRLKSDPKRMRRGWLRWQSLARRLRKLAFSS